MILTGRECSVDGEIIRITWMQSCFLRLLLDRPNELVHIDEIVEHLYGSKAPQRAKGSIYVMIKRLRKKGVPIHRNKHRGYKLEEEL